MDISEINAAGSGLLLVFVLTTLILGAVAAVTIILLANRLSAPLQNLSHAAELVSAGNLDVTIEPRGTNELQTLARTFNRLTRSVKRFLQQQVSFELAEEQRRQTEEIQERILELLEEVEPVSRGDLTVQARVTPDDIGTVADSYNLTVRSLREIVAKVQAIASDVTETTRNSEASVQLLSEEALHQAEEIAAALKKVREMAELVEWVATNAERATFATQKAVQVVEEGDAVMNRTVDGMSAIRETVAEARQKVKYLGETSQRITAVVNLISSFATQTKMLAFNAAIEADRAGQEGRGFAVVAEEVRSLAQQSAEASTEIEKLVAAIQGETNDVIAAMEQGTEQVVIGTKLVNETRHSLNKIASVSTEINQLITEITQATVHQSKASEEVTRTMTDVAEIATKTSKEADQVSSSFAELQKVAEELQEGASQFKID